MAAVHTGVIRLITVMVVQADQVVVRQVLAMVIQDVVVRVLRAKVMRVVVVKDNTMQVVVYREPSRGVYKKVIVRDDQILGAILLGETDTAGVIALVETLPTWSV